MSSRKRKECRSFIVEGNTNGDSTEVPLRFLDWNSFMRQNNLSLQEVVPNNSVVFVSELVSVTEK